MGKKDKVNYSRPNAPEFEQPLFQQPPHNPYYPNLNSHFSHQQQQQHPPPYTDLTVSPNTVPMTQINYPTAHSVDYPRTQGPVIIHQIPQNAMPYDRRAARYQRKIKSFNCRTFVLAIIATIMSYVSYRLYFERRCIGSWVVQKSNNVEVTINDVRDAHLTVAYGSAILAFICLLKSFIGESKSHSCYLFLIFLFTLVGTLFTGYLAYLAFYSPCTNSGEELVSNAAKKIISWASDNLPSPDKGVFGERNIIIDAKEDRNGLLIFVFDFMNFVFYFTVFITSTCMCC